MVLLLKSIACLLVLFTCQLVFLSKGLAKEELRVAIKEFSISWDAGDEVIHSFDYNALLETWRDEMGGKLTVDQMHILAARLTRTLRDQGFQFHKVIVPTQELKNGVLYLRVIEGRVGLIDVRNNQRYSNELLERPLEKYLNQAIFQPDIENTIGLLNTFPGLRVFSYYSRGLNTGEANINVSVTNEDSYDAVLSTDNHGTESTGLYRQLLSFTLLNPTNSADQLGLTILGSGSPTNTAYAALSYQRPFKSARHNMQMFASTNVFDVGGDFESLEITGESTSYKFAYLNKYKTLNRSQANFSFTYQSSESDIYTRLRDEALVQSNFDSTEANQTASLLWNTHAFSAKRGFSYGVDSSLSFGQWEIETKAISGDAEISDRQSQPDYTLLSFNPWLRLRLGKPNTWSGFDFQWKTRAQYAEEKVPSIERMGVSGANSVRSIRPGYYSGDRVVLSTMEWRWLASPYVQPSFFIDAAYAEQLDDQAEVNSRLSLMGSGIAMKLMYKNMFLDLSWATTNTLDSKELIEPEDSSLFLGRLTFSW